VIVRQKHNERCVNDKHDIARWHKAAFGFAMAPRMISITGLRFTSTARSDQSTDFLREFRSRSVVRRAIAVVVTAAMSGLDTWGINGRTGMFASVVTMRRTRSSMTQRTPEDQVQQQDYGGSETTNGGHEENLSWTSYRNYRLSRRKCP
tara:strand:- start:352 stop:798 length:447 start_codon:yes stop_codon:yes gene_type:complete